MTPFKTNWPWRINCWLSGDCRFPSPRFQGDGNLYLSDIQAIVLHGKTLRPMAELPPGRSWGGTLPKKSYLHEKYGKTPLYRLE
jgi:hypothetical protein